MQGKISHYYTGDTVGILEVEGGWEIKKDGECKSRIMCEEYIQTLL